MPYFKHAYSDPTGCVCCRSGEEDPGARPGGGPRGDGSAADRQAAAEEGGGEAAGHGAGRPGCRWGATFCLFIVFVVFLNVHWQAKETMCIFLMTFCCFLFEFEIH